MERKYFREVDILKGIAIFFVTLGHAIILFPVNLHENANCLALFNFVSSIHMQLFFLIAGFCFSFKGSYIQYLNKKAQRLVIPYIIFNLADMLPRYLFSSLVNRPRGIGESIYRICFLGGELWFLYVLFMIFLIFPFLKRLMEKGTAQEVILPCFVTILSYFSNKAPNVFLLNRTMYYLLFFTLGAAAKQHGQWFYEHMLRHAQKWWCIFLLLAWAGLFALQGQLNIWAIHVMTILTGSIFLLLFAMTCRISAVFVEPGRWSLQIYLFNGFLLVLSRTVVCVFFGITQAFTIILFNMIVTFLCSTLLAKYIIARFQITRIATGMGGMQPSKMNV